MITFGSAAIYGIHPRYWLRQYWWLWGVAWVMLFGLSGFWSQDAEYWQEHFQVKLPILLLPLAMACLRPFTVREQRVITWTLNLGVCFGVLYSMYFYLKNPEYVISGYTYAHVLPTIPKNDHIRFSMVVALTVCWNMYRLPSARSTFERALMLVCSGAFALFLHILAARAGLLALYILFAGLLGFYLLNRSTRKAGAILAVAIACLLAASYQLFPTLQRRVDYVAYTMKMYQSGGLQSNYSDMSRIISYDVARRIIWQHPIAGVGAGDMGRYMEAGYRSWYPDVQESEMLVPHNQLIIIALCCGIPGMILFLCWWLYPLMLIRKSRSGLFLGIAWFMLAVPMLAEPMLEIQFGVFVFLLFMLMFVKGASETNQPVYPSLQC